MQTTIVKKISPNQIFKIFDNYSDKVNVKFYEPLKIRVIKCKDFDTKIYYKICIRHNKDENPIKLLNNAIKLLK